MMLSCWWGLAVLNHPYPSRRIVSIFLRGIIFSLFAILAHWSNSVVIIVKWFINNYSGSILTFKAFVLFAGSWNHLNRLLLLVTLRSYKIVIEIIMKNIADHLFVNFIFVTLRILWMRGLFIFFFIDPWIKLLMTLTIGRINLWSIKCDSLWCSALRWKTLMFCIRAPLNTFDKTCHHRSLGCFSWIIKLLGMLNWGCTTVHYHQRISTLLRFTLIHHRLVVELMRCIFCMPQICSFWVLLSIDILVIMEVICGNEVWRYFTAFGIPKMPFDQLVYCS